MPLIRFLDASARDGEEMEATSLPPRLAMAERVDSGVVPGKNGPEKWTQAVPARTYMRLGFQPETFDSAGKRVNAPAVLYVWENIMKWMGR